MAWVLFSLSPLPPPPPQCLKAEDIASAVTFVLSAPPHVQVSPPSCLSAFCAVKVQRAEMLNLGVASQIGDVQMRPVEQVW